MTMDRKIKKSRKPFYIKLGVGALLAAGIAVAGYGFIQDSSVPTFRVEKERVTIGAVTQATFEDFIPVRGTVTPLKSVFLDAVEGGRVENIFVENGAIVQQGQPIIELSNTQLQLTVLSNEAQVSEQVNNLRNTRLDMERQKLQLKSDLVDMDYNITRLQRLVERRRDLAAQKLIPAADYIDTEDELAYYKARREVTLESQRQDEQMRLAQIESMESSVEQMQKNLEIARQNLENLTITAPIAGQLSSFDAELGQSLTPGKTVNVTRLAARQFNVE